jgi:hypothetical protein
MKDFLAFRTMLTPLIIQAIFWFGTVICVLAGLLFIMTGFGRYGTPEVLQGFALLILGPLVVRIYCELLIIFFRINETLTEIKHTLGDKRSPQA